MIRELTCIVCPKGCQLKVELCGKEIKSVVGHTCKRGEAYAITECTAPTRTVTTTVAVNGGGVLPVKTDKPIPKELIFACMEEVNKAKASDDTELGDIIIENVLNTGANIIATANAKK